MEKLHNYTEIQNRLSGQLLVILFVVQITTLILTTALTITTARKLHYCIDCYNSLKFKKV